MLKARRSHNLQLMDPFLLVLELIATNQKESVPPGLAANFNNLLNDFHKLVEGRIEIASVDRASLILKAIATERPALASKLLELHAFIDATPEKALDLVQSLEY